jgi:hypothetical protein
LKLVSLSALQLVSFSLRREPFVAGEAVGRCFVGERIRHIAALRAVLAEMLTG